MRLLLTGGDVTLDDLRALPPLGARLVFLSACQTGQADLRGLSDDAIGLPFALLTAGVAAVVSTLWPVHDRVTALFAGCFYRELAAMRRRGEPEDVALALQRSRRWLRTGRGFADPYFWAGSCCTAPEKDSLTDVTSHLDDGSAPIRSPLRRDL